MVKMSYTLRELEVLPTHNLKIITAGSWLFAVMLSSCPLFGWSDFTKFEGLVHCINDFSPNFGNQSYIIFCVIAGFLAPYTMTVIFNVKFLMKIDNLSKTIPVNKSCSVFLLSSTAAFTLSWMPMVAVGIASVFNLGTIPPHWMKICTLVTKLSIIADTLLFLLLNKTFNRNARATIKQLSRSSKTIFNS